MALNGCWFLKKEPSHATTFYAGEINVLPWRWQKYISVEAQALEEE
jgi:hypothetical protein